MFSPSASQAALFAEYVSLPIFIPDFANLQVVEGLNMTERLTPPYSVRISPTFGIALGDAFKHNTTTFSSEITAISCAAAGTVEAFNFQYSDGTHIQANSGAAAASSTITLLPEEHICGVSGYGCRQNFMTSRRNITCGTSTEGSRFETKIPDGSRAVGFFGTADGGSVTSFGVQYAKLPALGVLANNASKINVTVFDPLLMVTAGAANMWETHNVTALNAAKAIAAQELSPVYANIIANGDEAWAEIVPDPVTNATFYISVGLPNSEGLAPGIWVYATPVPASNITLPKVAVTIGTYSPGAGFGAAHPHIMTGIESAGEALVILAAVRGVVKWYSTYTRLASDADTVLTAELDAGFQDATYASSLAETFGVDAVTFNLLAASASAFPIGAIAFAIIASVAFIVEMLDRSYSLSVNVYNFDSVNQWVIDGWASNNGDVSGGAFNNTALQALNNTVFFDGVPLPSVNWTASWATYVFGNKDTIGNGVFIAMQTELGTVGSGKGFTFGYRIHATTEDNQMALMDGLTDLETFVNTDDGVWHKTKSLTSVNQATGLTIYADSPALSGVESSAYSLDISVGIPRSSLPKSSSATSHWGQGPRAWVHGRGPTIAMALLLAPAIFIVLF